MTFPELCDAIRAVLPEASIDTDFEGQIIVYTNLREDHEAEDPNAAPLVYVG